MPTIIDVVLPHLPDCWDTCGNCSDGELTVVEWLVRPGDTVKRFDPIVVVETDKTTLEIPTQENGEVVELCAATGSTLAEKSLLMRLKK